VGLGAIVVIGLEGEASRSTAPIETGVRLTEDLACFDVLGRSMVERVIDRLERAEVDAISVIAQEGSCQRNPSLADFKSADLQIVNDPYSAIHQKLKEYSRVGIDHAFLFSANAYAETDLLDLFYFHRESRQASTRAIDREGPLNLWVIDCAKAELANLNNLLAGTETKGPSYFVREYVNRLIHPRDLRRFASDVLRRRCDVRPPGREIKRGVWIDDGAEVHRGARLVAPAYIGRASKVMQDTLITRFSNVEKECCVEYGTVIENSSILQDTYVGICVDVCHAVVKGNMLLSLERNVAVEILDPSLLRENSLVWKSPAARDWQRVKKGMLFRRRKLKQAVTELQPAAGSAPKPCMLESNIQG
jgi:carbonic anhydrase/acetyltransferase-like protein (isoleucine patch superfamily)